MAHNQSPVKTSARYRAIKHGSLAYRRLRNKPVFQKLPFNRKWLLLLFLVIIPGFYVVSYLIERTHTTYYLFTGPKGGTYNVL